MDDVSFVFLGTLVAAGLILGSAVGGVTGFWIWYFRLASRAYCLIAGIFAGALSLNLLVASVALVYWIQGRPLLPGSLSQQPGVVNAALLLGGVIVFWGLGFFWRPYLPAWLVMFFPPNRALALGHISQRLYLRHVLLVLLLFVLVSPGFAGAIAHPEIYNYLPHYLSPRPLVNIIFDNRGADPHTGQTRDLSYLFDFFDAQFIALSVKLGWPHFCSLTYYVFTGLIVLVAWRFCTLDLGLDKLTGLSLILLYLTSPSSFLSVNYFRTAKIGASLTGVLLFYFLYRGIVNPAAKRGMATTGSWLMIFVVALTATLFDEQGVFIVGAATGYLAFRAVKVRLPGSLLPLGSCFASLACHVVYKYILAPQITFMTNGYWITFDYQNDPAWLLRLVTNSCVPDGVSLLLDTFRFMFGNLPVALAGPLLVFIFWTLAAGDKEIPRWRSILGLPAWLMFGLFMLAILVLNLGMVSRHPPLLWLDVRRVYYWLPTSAFLLMASFLVFKPIYRLNQIHKSAIQLILLILVMCNIMALPEHRMILQNGHLITAFNHGPKLIDGLRHLDDPRYAVPSDVAKDGLYKFFLAYLRR